MRLDHRSANLGAVRSHLGLLVGCALMTLAIGSRSGVGKAASGVCDRGATALAALGRTIFDRGEGGGEMSNKGPRGPNPNSTDGRRSDDRDGLRVIPWLVPGGWPASVPSDGNASQRSWPTFASGEPADPKAQFERLRQIRISSEFGDSESVRQFRASWENVPELIVAARVGYTEKVQDLLTKGVDPNTRSPTGSTALMESLLYGQAQIANMLLNSRASVGLSDEKGNTALHCAAWSGLPEAADELLRRGALVDAAGPDRITALMNAAKMGRVEVIRILLAHDANVSASDTRGRSALQYAAPVDEEESGGGVVSLRLLLEAGAPVNKQDDEGQTALMGATAAGDETAAKLLLAAGADPNLRNARGITALAMAQDLGYHEVAAALARAGGIAP